MGNTARTTESAATDLNVAVGPAAQNIAANEQLAETSSPDLGAQLRKGLARGEKSLTEVGRDGGGKGRVEYPERRPENRSEQQDKREGYRPRREQREFAPARPTQGGSPELGK